MGEIPFLGHTWIVREGKYWLFKMFRSTTFENLMTFHYTGWSIDFIAILVLLFIIIMTG